MWIVIQKGSKKDAYQTTMSVVLLSTATNLSKGHLIHTTTNYMPMINEIGVKFAFERVIFCYWAMRECKQQWHHHLLLSFFYSKCL